MALNLGQYMVEAAITNLKIGMMKASVAATYIGNCSSKGWLTDDEVIAAIERIAAISGDQPDPAAVLTEEIIGEDTVAEEAEETGAEPEDIEDDENADTEAAEPEDDGIAEDSEEIAGEDAEEADTDSDPEDAEDIDTEPDEVKDKETESEPESEDITDYNSMTVIDLKTIARERGLSGCSALSKAELVALLEADDSKEPVGDETTEEPTEDAEDIEETEEAPEE